MKVVQINTVCGIGSTGRITTDLHNALVERGHECLICYGRGDAPEDFKGYRIGTDLDVHLHALYSRITDRTAFASKRATLELLRKIEEFKPDIVHLHNLHGYYIHFEKLFQYLKQYNKPVIWSLYDCWSFTGHCCHFDYIGCDKWKAGCQDCPQKKEYPASYILDQSKKNYRDKKRLIHSINQLTVVPPTQWLSQILENSYLSDINKKIIPTGIDLEAFQPTSSNLRKELQLEDTQVVLGVSNGFGKFKGSKYFLQLAERLPKNYRLVLLGVTKEQSSQYPKEVLTLPRTNSTHQLAQFYTMADVFVNPTLQETQGLTSIEALACGTGVVTFQSGGSAESMNESCGIAVVRDDFEGLLQAVIQVCGNPFSPELCRKKAMEYDKKKLLKDYIDLYQNTLPS